jgi:hypothetical protein
LDFSDGETYRWGVASCGGCGASCGDVRREYPDQGEWHAEAIAEWNRRSPAAPDLQAELDATNRQVEILSDALAESRRQVDAMVALARADERNRTWTQEHWTDYERSIAAAEREACAKTKAGKPRELKAVGRGTLLDEQQFCFDKGWREGAASVRAAIRSRGVKNDPM